MKFDAKAEIGEAKIRAVGLLNRGMSADKVAKRIAGEFNICIYFVKRTVMAMWVGEKGVEYAKLA